MSRTQRLRADPLLLTEVGEANTTTILDHVNQRFRWGATMNQLGNVAGRRFVVGFDEGTDIGSHAFVCGPWRPLEAKQSRIGLPCTYPWQGASVPMWN